MRKSVLIILVLMLGMIITSCEKKEVRSTIDFEDLQFEEDGYWNGSDGSGNFFSGNGEFVNRYDTEWQSWSGFAYTNHTDNVTYGLENEYSSIAGSGSNGSSNYGVYFYFQEVSDTIWFDIPMQVDGISLSNTTYAYYSMLDGSAFSKKFGGESGDDKDWFMVTLTAIGQDRKNPVGYVEVMMADYRFDDNALDYIANVWTNIDLSLFGYIGGLAIRIESSDTGEYGINTPAYVCIDDIKGILFLPSE